jgi:hypothetical protein
MCTEKICKLSEGHVGAATQAEKRINQVVAQKVYHISGVACYGLLGIRQQRVRIAAPRE